MTITLSNARMAKAIETLGSLSETGKLGYAVARNRRRLTEAATEYIKMRDELIEKYGTHKQGAEFSLTIEAQNRINSEMKEYAAIEHDVDIMTVDERTFYGGGLTSGQMYALDFMVEAD